MKRSRPRRRVPAGRHVFRGNVLVTVALLLPALLAVAALVLDGSALIGTERRMQHSADSIVLAAATAMLQEGSAEAAVSEGHRFANQQLGIPSADITVTSPPDRGPYAGRADCVSVTVRHTSASLLSQVLDGVLKRNVQTWATACVGQSDARAAVVTLDRTPELLSITGLPSGIGSSLALAGLEVEGVGTFRVEDAIHVNSLGGLYDEDGNRVGDQMEPPYGVACVPGSGLTKIETSELRVAGGVVNPDNYGPSLIANRLPVPDPHRNVPVPIPGAHSGVSGEYRGHVTVDVDSALGNPTVLEPGIYDWIQVVSGQVVFQPGVYIITGKNPVTGHALEFLGGEVSAEGTMFYIGRNWGAGATVSSESEPPYTTDTLTPSVVFSETLGPSSFTGLDNPVSPFHGFLLYQERVDRRPIVIATQQLLGRHSLAGHVYAKWGHVILAGQGHFGLSLVAGTVRVAVVSELHLDPVHPLPAARDVYLVD